MVDHLPQISQTICVSAAMLLLLPSSAAAALGCLCFPNSRNFAVPRKEHPTTTTTTTSRVYSSDWVFPSGFLLFINSLFTMCVQFCFHPRCKERRRGGVMVNRLNLPANQTRRVAAIRAEIFPFSAVTVGFRLFSFWKLKHWHSIPCPVGCGLVFESFLNQKWLDC